VSVIDSIEAIPVHISSSDVPVGGSSKKRCRYAARTRTFTLSSQNTVDAILPQADTRTEAWFAAWSPAAAGTLFMSPSQANAAQQAGGCIAVPFLTTTGGVAIEPTWYPLNTTDQMWASASSGAYPVTISVLSIYEEPE
jgi:hypothetical protein